MLSYIKIKKFLTQKCVSVSFRIFESRLSSDAANFFSRFRFPQTQVKEDHTYSGRSVSKSYNKLGVLEKSFPWGTLKSYVNQDNTFCSEGLKHFANFWGVRSPLS